MARFDVVNILDDLGFNMGGIVETIVTTRNSDMSLNAAPMGIKRTEPDILEIKPFKSSATYQNLLVSREACVNVTSEPELFLVTAFKHEKPRYFENTHISENLYLESADAHIFIDILSYNDISEERGCFVCKVRFVEVLRHLPRVFSRGRAEAIEAIVHATRIENFMRMGWLKEAEMLNDRFNECKKVVERVSETHSNDVRIIRTLEKFIDGWRKKSSKSL